MKDFEAYTDAEHAAALARIRADLEKIGRTMTPAERSFDAGYRYGKSRGAVELSPREVSARFPDVADGDAFAQGMLDGLARDDWRHRCMVEHIRAGNNMDNVLLMEITDRAGDMDAMIGHGPQEGA